MEERNLELDDDGKIRIRKNSQVLPEEGEEPHSDDGIVIDVPDFKGFGEENEGEQHRDVADKRTAPFAFAASGNGRGLSGNVGHDLTFLG